MVEGLNNKIPVVTRRSYGFRAYEATEIALYHAQRVSPYIEHGRRIPTVCKCASSRFTSCCAHLRALQVDEDVANLKALVSIYRQKTGHLPTMFGDLDLEGCATYRPIFSDIPIS